MKNHKKSKNPMEKRFENMIKAKKVCLIYKLNRLVVPPSKTFEVNYKNKKITLISEKYLDISQDESAQEELYQKLPNLDETIRELAIFTIKTGLQDVEWRNISIIKDNKSNIPRVALPDLEEMEEPSIGIFGSEKDTLPRRGLIRCLFSEKHIDIVLDIAKRYGVVNKDLPPKKAKAKRLKEIESYNDLHALYKEKGIDKNPRQEINITDLTTLGLDLNATARYNNGNTEEIFTMKEVIIDVIKKINDRIKNSSDKASTKGKRSLQLSTNNGNLGIYESFGLPKNSFSISDEEYNKRWLYRILNALIKHKHLVKIDKQTGRGYFIQA
jgi:hypothetical protein